MLAYLFLPTLLFAGAPDVAIGGGLPTIMPAVLRLLSIVFGILLTVAVFMLILGIFQFVVHAGDEEERKHGRAKIIWSVVSVFLMFSVWGLVNILINTVGLNNTIPLNARYFLGGIH